MPPVVDILQAPTADKESSVFRKCIPSGVHFLFVPNLIYYSEASLTKLSFDILDGNTYNARVMEVRYAKEINHNSR